MPKDRKGMVQSSTMVVNPPRRPIQSAGGLDVKFW